MYSKVVAISLKKADHKKSLSYYIFGASSTQKLKVISISS